MIIGTLLVRDEEDIIETCLQHNLSQVDKLIVTDNGSVDSTREILEKYNLRIIDEPEHNYKQSDWVTRMARLACEYNPDWIVHMDADELWCGLQNLYKVKKEIGIVRVWYERSHLPFPDLEYKSLKLPDDMPCYVTKKANGKVAHRPNRNVVVSQGNHYVENVPGEILELESYGILWYHHFFARSYQQLEKKIINGTRAYESNPEKGYGTHWKSMYESWKDGKLPEIYDSFVIREMRENLQVCRLLI